LIVHPLKMKNGYTLLYNRLIICSPYKPKLQLGESYRTEYYLEINALNFGNIIEIVLTSNLA